MKLRRAAVGVAGWLLTAGAVVAIIIVVSGDHRFSRTAEMIVAIATGLALLVPAVVGAAYMAVRRRNRATDATAGQRPASPRARALQTSLASMLDRVSESTDDALGLRRVVLADRLELTATALGEIDDPWETLSFIWFVRPSQPAHFPQSQQFEGLPVWAQDAVVLLDLRRDIQLRGIAPVLADDPGFYHHGSVRIVQAATRARSAELVDAFRAAQQMAADPARAREHEGHGRRLLELLDDPRVWSSLLGAAKQIGQ